MEGKPESPGSAKAVNPWTRYYEQTEKWPANESLVRALALTAGRERALDLGAGALRDAQLLLSNGFEEVVLLDREPGVAERARALQDPRMTAVTAAFDAYDYPPASFDIVNAQYALPFNPPETLGQVLEAIQESLKEGGIFVGNLFGQNDSWSDDARMSFHSLEEARGLLACLEIIELEEKEKDGTTSSGVPKHWDVIHFTARKSAPKQAG